MEYIRINEWEIPVFYYDAVIVGSGAAGYNAADTLYSLGKTNIALITEGRVMGTSRNTGSDKQTYYKISTTGAAPDSVYDMAQTLFNGGSMNGDTALIEAAYSLRSFFKLVSLGVPFPHNEYGEYVGYQTDHDVRKRATSCGPLTSKYMTEALERSVVSKGIQILNGHRVIKILAENGDAKGILTMRPSASSEENPFGICAFIAHDVIYAVGGPSAIYADTVYPPSQSCGIGAAFLAGAEGASLTESQYGIASVKFRWNLSGTYQQVIPKYVSIDENGIEREFLREYFSSDAEMLDAIFKKGYQWPFDPRKLAGESISSNVDIAVYNETQKGRRVYLDFRSNPTGFDIDILSRESREYLENSSALFGTPIERLKVMNMPAIELYRSNGIDIETELLEIAVCAQHMSGGLAVTTDYESTTLRHFYPVGECAGVFGVYRPGGSALNSTQVSSTRAAEAIAKHTSSPELTCGIIEEIKNTSDFLTSLDSEQDSDFLSIRNEAAKLMSRVGAFMRRRDEIPAAIEKIKGMLEEFTSTHRVSTPESAVQAMINYDILTTIYVCLSAENDYISDGGKSRGSYIICDSTGISDVKIDNEHTDKIQYTKLENGVVSSVFKPRREIPESEQWFETVYRSFKSGK